MRYLRLAVCLLLLLKSLPNTVISGQIVNLTGTPMSSNRTVTFALQNCGTNIPMVVGSAIIVPASLTMIPNPAGMLSGTLVGNDIISCGTTVGQTYYQVTIYAGTTHIYQQMYAITGPAWNIATANPLSSDPTAFMNYSGYVIGDLIYGSGTNTLSTLHGNVTTTMMFLCGQGTGTSAAAPYWCFLNRH